MSDITCPDCGAPNPATAETCARCNFPFVPPAAPAPAAQPPTAIPSNAKHAAAGSEARPFDPGPRPVRPRRTRGTTAEPVQLQLWLVAGLAVVLGIIYFAAQGYVKTNVPSVEGSSAEQQQAADLARAAVAKDSTNLAARIQLANVLYDTGNWSEAIVHYRSAARLDPQRATTAVDMGVCYYNLSQFAAAESLFQRALTLDPNQSVALFNLGVVAETREKWDEALDYYHRAMQANPSQGLIQAVSEHLKTVMSKTGKTPPPLKNAK